MEEKKRIKSQKLLGITEDHDYHRDDSPMYSTGNLVLLFEDETDPRNWYVEYRCSVCNELVCQRGPKVHDLIRAALKENGILKNT